MKTTETPTRLFDLVGTSRRRTDDSTLVAYALVRLGIRRGDIVAVMAQEGKTSDIFEMGALKAGAVVLPLDDTLAAEEYIAVVQQAPVRVLLVEDDEQYQRFRLLLPQLGIDHIFSVGVCGGVMSVADLCQLGRQYPATEQLRRIDSLISTDETCRLEYMKGKGLRPLSHKRVLQERM